MIGAFELPPEGDPREGTERQRPAPECRKCGSFSGFQYVKPTYSEGLLTWACGYCGYVIVTPPADAA